MTAAAVPLSPPRWFGRLSAAAAVSFAIHAALVVALFVNATRPIEHRPNEITLDVREIERPKPPPPPPPPKVMPAEKVPRLAVKPVEKPPPLAPPPPNQPPPKEEAKPPPIRIGVNLESTVSGGDFAAPVGNTMYGQAPPKALEPVAAKPYWAAKYVPAGQVAEIPQLLDEVKAPYPPQARKDGVEGDVILLLTIDDHGNVAKVRKVVGIGHGLDEAAIDAVKRFKFKPARYNGVAVATEIRWVYSWEID
jgi:periplasmic protein TonB